MMRRYLATFTLLLFTTTGGAANLTPRLEDAWLGLLAESIDWPATLQKDLTSGLVNRILIRVTLARGAEMVQQRAVEIAVRYDLWEERFAVQVLLDGVEVETRSIASLSDMQAALRQLTFTQLFAIGGMSSTQYHTLSAEVLLNPIDRERMKMIKKWVAENSIAPADIAGRNSGGELAAAIFNRIFEQYARGADIAAVWRETSISPPFRLDELSDESE